MFTYYLCLLLDYNGRVVWLQSKAKNTGSSPLWKKFASLKPVQPLPPCKNLNITREWCPVPPRTWFKYPNHQVKGFPLSPKAALPFFCSPVFFKLLADIALPSNQAPPSRAPESANNSPLTGPRMRKRNLSPDVPPCAGCLSSLSRDFTPQRI